MTDDRAEKLARAIYPRPGGHAGPADKSALTYARRALAAIDADPETYGYLRFPQQADPDFGAEWVDELPPHRITP